jgi:hypothetical protein
MGQNWQTPAYPPGQSPTLTERTKPRKKTITLLKTLISVTVTSAFRVLRQRPNLSGWHGMAAKFVERFDSSKLV